MEATSNNNSFSSAFSTTGISATNAKIFFWTLKTKISECFKKVKIQTRSKQCYGNQELQTKLKLKADIRIYRKNCKCNIAKVIAEQALHDTEIFLEENFAEQTANIVKKKVAETMSQQGKLSHRGMWKIKRSLFP